MEFKIEGSLNLSDKNQVNAAIAFLTALHANPVTETEVKKLNVVAAEVVTAPVADAKEDLSPAQKAAATKKANAAAKADAAKEELKTEEAENEDETPAAEAAREKAPAETTTADFSKDDCRELLGAISLAGFKTEIKALLVADFGVTSITSLTDDQVDPCYSALKKLATELKVKLD